MAELYGLQVEDLPEGWEPVEAVCVVKCLRPEDADFPYGLIAVATGGLSTWEAEGMLSWAARNADGTEDEDG
ncbi:hypothetical protein [Actinomadura miaoliensis]|uniref:Uncharacterized protein n=1 Tax=Actinomadura miaoliensis TaxID=430685 RepID=A0ABP7W7B4_9ACTN